MRTFLGILMILAAIVIMATIMLGFKAAFIIALIIILVASGVYLLETA